MISLGFCLLAFFSSSLALLATAVPKVDIVVVKQTSVMISGSIYVLIEKGMDFNALATTNKGCPLGFVFSGYTSDMDKQAANLMAPKTAIWVNEATKGGKAPQKSGGNTLVYVDNTALLTLPYICKGKASQVPVPSPKPAGSPQPVPSPVPSPTSKSPKPSTSSPTPSPVPSQDGPCPASDWRCQSCMSEGSKNQLSSPDVIKACYACTLKSGVMSCLSCMNSKLKADDAKRCMSCASTGAQGWACRDICLGLDLGSTQYDQCVSCLANDKMDSYGCRTCLESSKGDSTRSQACMTCQTSGGPSWACADCLSKSSMSSVTSCHQCLTSGTETYKCLA